MGRGLTSPEVSRGKQIVSAKALTSRLIHDGTYAAAVEARAIDAKEI